MQVVFGVVDIPTLIGHAIEGRWDDLHATHGASIRRLGVAAGAGLLLVDALDELGLAACYTLSRQGCFNRWAAATGDGCGRWRRDERFVHVRALCWMRLLTAAQRALEI